MSKRLIIKSLVASTLLLSVANASEQNFIEVGAGFKKTTDNFVARDDFTATDNSNTETIPNIQFAYHVPVNEKFTAYVKSQYGKFNLGSYYKYNDSKVDFGLMVDMITHEEWQDPFNKSTNNDKTDVTKKGAYIAYSTSVNKDLRTTLKYQNLKSEYDNDVVSSSLKREGNEHIISSKNVYKGIIINLNYKVYNADGDASSYKAYEVELGKKYKIGDKLSVLVLADMGTLEYDEENPELNKVIDATTYGIKTQVKYQEPFNYKNTYVSLSAGYDKENSNDEFYDRKTVYGIASLGYKF